jgi:nucleoside-diphosphate-sugar epimerase
MAYELTGKKCMITGATGLIGSNVTLRLLKDGAVVRLLVRDRTRACSLEQSGAEVFIGDITEPDSIKKALEGCQLVFHFAGVLNDFKPRSFYDKVNVEGTNNLALAAIDSGVERFIHTSTVMVYGMKAAKNINEDSPYCTSNDNYCDTKLEGEQVIRGLVKTKSLPAIIIQPSEVYGPGDRTWTAHPIELIRHGKMVLANGGTGIIQPIYISDLVDGILAAATVGRIGEAYILCGNEPVTVYEYFGHLARILGKPVPPKIPAVFALGAASLAELTGKLFHTTPAFTRQEVRMTMLHTSFDGRKAHAELGFLPKIPVSEGMKLVEKWVKNA